MKINLLNQNKTIIYVFNYRLIKKNTTKTVSKRNFKLNVVSVKRNIRFICAES